MSNVSEWPGAEVVAEAETDRAESPSLLSLSSIVQRDPLLALGIDPLKGHGSDPIVSFVSVSNCCF